MKTNKNLFICFCLIVSASFGQTERDVINSIDSINSLALRHYIDNDIVNSFNFYNKSLRLSDSINDAYGRSVANFNLGKIYSHMEDYDKAEERFVQALAESKTIDDNFLVANSYLNLGKIYRKRNQLDKVVAYFKKGIQYGLKNKVRDQNNTDKRQSTLFDIRINLADVYIEKHELREAHIYLGRAHNSIESIEKPFYYYYEGRLNYTFGLYLMEKGLYNLAIDKFKEAEINLKNCNSDFEDLRCNLLLTQVYENMSDSLLSLGKREEAYNVLVQYNDVREQFFNEEKLKQVQITESKFLIANYKHEAELANKAKLAQQGISERVKLLNIGFVIVILILLSSLVFFYKNYLAKRKLNSILRVRNEQLKISKSEALKSSQLKSDFISNVTHELRTPLYGVVGLTSLLLESKDLSERDVEHVKSLKYSSDYLLNLVNDILQIGKMESEKVILKNVSVDLHVLVEKIVKSFEGRLQESNNKIQVSFDHEIPKFIKCDNVKLSQILINLISNSIKFTKNGKIQIRIKLENTTEKDVSLRFEIEDNGSGIDKTQHKAIFEKFSQFHEIQNINNQGTGLGLTIVKNLVNLFNGDLELESELGRGSKFSFNVTFSIDKNSNYTLKKKDEDKVARLKTGFKILIAEDNKINQIVTKKLLQKENFECQIAQNGLEAVQALRDNNFDLILMDINMPIMNGNEATKEIRKSNPRIPIIALTAADIEEVKKEYMSIGYDGIITKPFDNNEFFQMIYTNIQNSILEKVS